MCLSFLLRSYRPPFGFAAARMDVSRAHPPNVLTRAVNAGKDHFFYAGYDSPFTIAGRHNEVWFVVPDPDCETS